MVAMKNAYTTLFLHGSGFHGAIERAWFGDSLPVLWWDQPAIAADDPAPFQTLVGHAVKQIQVLADADLVSLESKGRDVLVKLNPSTLEKAKKFIAKLEEQWDIRLNALKNFVESED